MFTAWRVAGGRERMGQLRTVLPVSILLLRGLHTSCHAWSQCVWPILEAQIICFAQSVIPRPNPPPQLSLDLGDRHFRGRSSLEPKSMWCLWAWPERTRAALSARKSSVRPCQCTGPCLGRVQFDISGSASSSDHRAVTIAFSQIKS